MPDQNWKVVCILLCAVGFFKSFRPSEPFLTQYLVGPWVNLTLEEVYAEVFPVATYSYLAVIVIILLITDFLRYKPIIVLEALTFIGTYVLITQGRSLLIMQIAEFVYAMSISCEIAYYTYMYTKVTDEHYQKVTGYARAAVLIGICLAGIIGQVLIITKTLDYYHLNYITLSSACVTLLLALFLPSVPTSLYFHKVTKQENEYSVENVSSSTIVPNNSSDALPIEESPRHKTTRWENFFRLIKIGILKVWTDIKASYHNASVLKWSIWWAFGTCLNNQVINYIQPLWETLRPTAGHNVDIYNGAVEAACTLLGAVAALVVGFIPINWSLYGEPALAAVSILDAACLCLLGMTKDIWVAYGSYIAFRVAYQLLITIASFQVAQDLKPDTYSLIFGCNTFVALVIQTILVVIVVDKSGLALEPTIQFIVYSVYSLILGIVFFITSIFTCIRSRTSGNEEYNVN